MTYSIMKKAYQSLKNKMICIYSFILLLTTLIYGKLIVENFGKKGNINFLPIILFTIIFIVFHICYLYVLIKKCKHITEVYEAKNQYIQIDKNKITMMLYDEVQNKALTYNREDVIYQGINILHINSFKKHLLTYQINGDFEETFMRRNPFTIQKKNKELVIYRIFENDKEIQRIFTQFKR